MTTTPTRPYRCVRHLARPAKAPASYPRDDRYEVCPEDDSVKFFSRSGEDYSLDLDPLAEPSRCSCDARRPCRHQKSVWHAPRPSVAGSRLLGGSLTLCTGCGGERHQAHWLLPLYGYQTYVRCGCYEGVRR